MVCTRLASHNIYKKLTSFPRRLHLPFSLEERPTTLLSLSLMVRIGGVNTLALHAALIIRVFRGADPRGLAFCRSIHAGKRKANALPQLSCLVSGSDRRRRFAIPQSRQRAQGFDRRETEGTFSGRVGRAAGA